MNVILALFRLVAIAFGLSLLLAWLKDGNADLALTLPWTLYPVGGGFVAARCAIDWESQRQEKALLAGLVRIAGFFAVVAVAHWGFPGSLVAVAMAFVTTLALARYPLES